jgi:hypothetical protein
MNRSIVLAVLALAACLESHSNKTQVIDRTNCYQCHQPDYEGTQVAAVADWTIPDHIKKGYKTTCADCHITTTWFSHPEALFPIQTPAHSAVKVCADCHDAALGADAFGTNTTCVACHPGTESVGGTATLATSHASIAGFSYTTPAPGFTTNNFCLSCHPDGRAGRHPDNLFSQRHGNAKTCTDCHDRTKGPDTGGANVTCTSSTCHVGVANKHTEVSGYDPTKCLHCHPGGRN